MNNNRNNSPELDYFELRRRHEEYKNRARAAQNPEKSVAEKLERELSRKQAQQSAPKEEEVLRPTAAPVEADFEEELKDDPLDAFDEAIEEGYEDYEEDYEEDFDEADQLDENPNPFDPFIRFFHGVKDNISSRRSGKHADEDDLEDFDDLDEEELMAALSAEEEAPVRTRPARAMKSQPVEDELEDAEDFAMDIEDNIPRVSRRAPENLEEDTLDFDPDEDFEDEPAEKGGFKKFMSLFVTRVDDAEIEEDDDFADEDEYVSFDDMQEEDDVEISDVETADEDFDEDDFEDAIEENVSERRPRFSLPIGKGKKKHHRSHRVVEDDEFTTNFIRSVHGNAEGGQKMDEMKKPAPEATQPAAASTEGGMSRRERRELAMRLAAEEAARKAAEEAARAAEEKAKAEASTAIEPLFDDLKVEPIKVDMAAFEDAPEVDVLVETTAADAPAFEEESVDEPTREFKPVSMRDVQEAADSSLFGVDDEDEDDEDDDEDEEIVEKKPRRGLFGRKRAKVEEDDDDYDDEDDDEDEDYDDDEDEEDEVVEKKPRRGLFGRKRAKDEEEDEDDEDDYDDDEDEEDESEDEDDEYDEYDDDEDEDEYDDDDDEYDDDDEPRRSFGHHLIGIIKAILAIILILLIVVIGLNFHYYLTGNNVVVTKIHEILGDSPASNVLCFGYNMYEAMPAAEVDDLDEVVIPEVSVEPTAIPQPESTTAIPDLDTNGAITETPVVQAAPVVEAAPVVNNGTVG